MVRGSAVKIAHDVTQASNIEGNALETVGETVRQWIETAPCFASGSEVPSVKGMRGLAVG